MKKKRFAILGCGFWSQFQIGGWQELPGNECVALYNRTLSKARELGNRFGIEKVYEDAEEMMKNEKLDFIDIITDVDTHRQFVELGARYGVDVICQKPMAANWDDAKQMVKVTREAGVRYYVHENYRWQPQIRRVKQILDSGIIGKPFRARTWWNTAFPVFETQPFLAHLEQFALTDQGSHQFDVVRYLFGEAESIYTQIQTVNPTIKGDDVATSLIRMKNGMVVSQEISFSSPLEVEVFPQTLMLIEGDKGSVRLDADFNISTTTPNDTCKEEVKMRSYPWQTDRLKPEPPSIVDINKNILDDMMGIGKAENTGEDNLETMRMVWAAYHSANTNTVIVIDEFL